jgi:hypothetical protein
MANNSSQDIAEFWVKRNLAMGGNPESFLESDDFLTHQDKVMIAYRNSVKKVNTNFPIKF